MVGKESGLWMEGSSWCGRLFPARYLLFTPTATTTATSPSGIWHDIGEKHAIYSPKSHDFTQAFFIFNQKGDVCALSFFNLTHESLIGNQIRFWYLVYTELISSVVSLSFDVGRRRLTCPFPCPSSMNQPDVPFQTCSGSRWYPTAMSDHPSSLLGPPVSSMWGLTICMSWLLPSEWWGTW